MAELVNNLALQYELVLLSDHASEWVKHIQQIHPFLEIFTFQFFSYQLGQTKRQPSTFLRVLDTIHKQSGQCLFIDDNPANILAAEITGIKGILFVNSEQLVQELANMKVFQKGD